MIPSAWQESGLLLRGVELSWPFPQAYRGRLHNVVLGQNGVAFFDGRTLELENALAFDAENPEQESEVPTGLPWSHADLGDAFISANGSCVVFKTNFDNVVGSAARVFVSSNYCTSLCLHKGRVFYGGLKSHPAWGELGSRTVAWTRIQGGDVFWPFIANRGLNVEDYVEENDAGYLVLPMNGCVKQLLPLNDHVIVYADTFVMAIHSTELGVSTKMLFERGVASTKAACLGGERHVFVDVNGDVNVLGADLVVQTLGYGHLGYGCDETVVTYDNAESEFYISNASGSLVLTTSGLGHCARSYSTILPATQSSSMCGVFNTCADVDTVEFVTTPMDIGARGLKFIQVVESAFDNFTDVEVAIYYRYTQNIDFVEADVANWKPVNKEGVVFPLAAFVEFKLAFRAIRNDILEELEGILRWMRIGYKVIDRRFVRGVYSSNVDRANV